MKRRALRGLRGGDQVARTLAADAGVGGIRRRHLGLVELARQIGELMNDDVGTRRDHGRAHRRRVEHVKDGGHNPCPLKLLGRGGRTRRAGDAVTSIHEQWHKPPADGARGACKKDAHGGNVGQQVLAVER